MKRRSGQIEKIRNFLYQMGALPRYRGKLEHIYRSSNDVLAFRRFRKIKRLAFERMPSYAKNDSAYQAIYQAFKLHQYSRGGYYWKDLRKTFRQPRWDNETNKLVYDEPKFHYSACRRWSLNGTVSPEEFERIKRIPPL